MLLRPYRYRYRYPCWRGSFRTRDPHRGWPVLRSARQTLCEASMVKENIPCLVLRRSTQTCSTVYRSQGSAVKPSLAPSLPSISTTFLPVFHEHNSAALVGIGHAPSTTANPDFWLESNHFISSWQLDGHEKSAPRVCSVLSFPCTLSLFIRHPPYRSVK